jgi:hypothetical protein
MLDRSIRGLRPHTRTKVKLRDPHAFVEAYEIAEWFDTISYLRTDVTRITRPRVTPREPDVVPMNIDALTTPNRPTAEERDRLRREGLCFFYRKKGNILRDCREYRPSGKEPGRQ